MTEEKKGKIEKKGWGAIKSFGKGVKDAATKNKEEEKKE